MNTNNIVTLGLAVIANTHGAFADPVWQPSDFESAYVSIIDDAKNGCWTNIGEVQMYAKDQLELAGFNVIEKPENNADLPHPVLRENITAYRLYVKASRKDNGVCFGYLNSSFWGEVTPGYDQSIAIVGQLGIPYIWPVWNKDNLNQYMFDQVKSTIEAWVKMGLEFDVKE